MKKNIVNDKVIRAMAIGISAMLATATPMTALAAEEGNDGEGAKDAGQESQPTSDVCDKAQEAGGYASESTGTAQSSVEKVKNDIEKNNTETNDTETSDTETNNTETNDTETSDTATNDIETKVVAGEAGKDSEGKDLAQAVIDAAALTENITDKKGSSVEKAKTDITNANDQIDVAETNDGLSDAAYNQADTKAEEAAKIASEVKEDMNKAKETADKQVEQIQNATTVADANAAYDELAATADQAQKDFNTKLNAYNEAKSAYDEAAAKVKEYEKKYNEAIANAGTNAAEAQAELAQAKVNAEKLEKAVEKAEAAVDKSAADAMAIAELEALTADDNEDGKDVLNWRNEDKLFIAIMEKYYLPKTQGIQGAVVTRVQGKDNNEYNYFTATYKENGVTQVKYFNYKMDDEGKSKDKIVIFEKREVETKDVSDVLLHEYDVCVDKNGKEVDVDNAIKDGTIGNYVENSDMTTAPETLVSDSEITNTSERDVTVDEDSKQESWSYNEETGELVKTVTADVTTITYIEDSFSGERCEDVQDRNTKIDTLCKKNNYNKDADGNLIDANGKKVTITETEETTYTHTATGTYIPTFTKTVEIKNEEVEKKYSDINLFDKGVKTQSEAYEVVFDRADEKWRKELKNELNLKKDEELYLIESSKTLEVSGYTKGTISDDSDFLVSGTVTATYAKVTKQTVDRSTFGSLWDDIKALITGGQSTNEKLEEAARKVVEAEGGILIGANWDDGRFNKATIRYVAGVKVTTEEKDTEEAAKNAVADAALAQATAGGATGVYNVQTTDTDKIEHTTYSYTVNYLKQDGTKTETKTIATETYGNASGLSGQIIQNKNYLDGNILLDQKDEDYRKFVDDAKALTGKYDRLLEEAKQANADVFDAQAKVDALKKEIEDLKGKSTNTKKLAELEAELVIAKADRDAAKDTLDDIIDKLKDAETTRDEVVDKLTPKKPGGGNGGNGGNRDNNPGGGTSGETDDAPGADTTTEDTTTVPTVITTTATDNVVVTAPVAAVANGAGAGNVAAGNAGAGNAAGNVAAGNQGVVTIEDEAAPLAASIDEQDAADTKEAKEDVKTVTIEDEEAPLDASIDQEKMSWWWLLIVMVLGATGYEMYRKHQEKKKAAEEIKVEE